MITGVEWQQTLAALKELKTKENKLFPTYCAAWVLLVVGAVLVAVYVDPIFIMLFGAVLFFVMFLFHHCSPAYRNDAPALVHHLNSTIYGGALKSVMEKRRHRIVLVIDLDTLERHLAAQRARREEVRFHLRSVHCTFVPQQVSDSLLLLLLLLCGVFGTANRRPVLRQLQEEARPHRQLPSPPRSLRATTLRQAVTKCLWCRSVACNIQAQAPPQGVLFCVVHTETGFQPMRLPPLIGNLVSNFVSTISAPHRSLNYKSNAPGAKDRIVFPQPVIGNHHQNSEHPFYRWLLTPHSDTRIRATRNDRSKGRVQSQRFAVLSARKATQKANG